MIFRIESILVVWATTWAREKGCKGYPALQSFAREMPTVVKHRAIRLSDEDCLEIDRQLRKLHDFNLVQYQILMAVYLQDIDDREIWRTMGLSKAKFYRELEKAKAFMSGALIAREIKVYP